MSYPNVFEIEEPSTGKRYRVEGVEGTTRDEAIEYLGSLPEDEISKREIRNQAPVETQPQPSAPVADPAGVSGVQSPEVPQTQYEQVWVQGPVDNVDREWIEPEAKARIDSMMADPNISYEDIDAAVREQARVQGMPDFGLSGSAEQLAAYRQSLAQGQDPVAAGYQSWAESIPLNDLGSYGEGDQGFLTEIIRSVENAWTDPASGVSAIGRTASDWLDIGGDIIDEKYPNITPEQREQMQEEWVGFANRKLFEASEAGVAEDSFAPWILGQLVAPDPVDLIPITRAPRAASKLGRVGEKAAEGALVSGAADAGYQGLAIADDAQDEFDSTRLATAAGLGGALHSTVQGTAEGVGALASTRSRRIDPDYVPDQVMGNGRGLPGYRSEAAPVVDAAPISVPTSRRNSKTYRAEITETANGIVDNINRTTEGWTNAPEFEVHESFRDLDGVDNDAIGVMTGDGKILINATNVVAEAKAKGTTPETIVNAVTFHEALGHYGLAQKFGDELETVLDVFYNNSSSTFRHKVDRWLIDNPNAYKNVPHRVRRAAEEVLAEMSEKGRIPVTFLNRLTSRIKNFARDMGLTIKFSKTEIETILGMAHNAVISGKGRDVRGNGFRYMNAIPNRELVERYMREDGMDRMQAVNRARAEIFKGSSRSGMGKRDTSELDAYIERRMEERRAQQREGGDRRDDGNRYMKGSESNDNPDNNVITFGSWRQPVTLGKYLPNKDAWTPGERLQIQLNELDGKYWLENNPVKQRDIQRQIRSLEAKLDKYYESIAPRNDRYMKKTSADEMFEAKNALDILRQITADYKPTAMSMDDLRAEAEARGIDPAKILRNKELDLGELPRRFLMQDIAAEQLNEKVSALYNKIQSGEGTRKDRLAHAQALLKYKELTARIFDEQGEAGRLLRTIQELQYTKKKITSIKDSLEGFTSEDLQQLIDDPDAYLRFAKSIQDQADEAAASAKKSKIGDRIANTLNIPRAIMSSLDLSAPFRQGLFLVGRPEFWKSLPSMFKYLVSEDAYDSLMLDITKSNTYPYMVEGGVAFSSRTGKMSAREESFQSEYATRIPILGRGIKATERAYNGFLNKLRADTFNNLFYAAEKAGVDVYQRKFLKSLGSFISHATGRGNLGGVLNSAAPLLNAFFFSPRLMASRVQLLNPQYYITLDPFVRREAIKSLLTATGFVSTVLGLGALAGAEVELDPRSSDFGKMKTGNTRYDIPGGFAQYITLGARLTSGSQKTSMGEISEYGNDFGQTTRLDAVAKFLSNKAAPIPSFVMDALRGEDAVGEPFNMSAAVASRFMPMFAQDAVEVMQEYGPVEGVLRAAPSVLGVGIQNYVPAAADPEREVLAPDSFEMQELEDGETELISVSDGVVTLKGEAQEEWQRILTIYVREWMRDEMADPNWDKLTLEEKAEIIKEVRNDARRQAKQDMLPLLGLDNEEGSQ